MDHASSWDFTLANYGAVWAFCVQAGVLLLFLMLGNILRRTVPLFRKYLVPSALLGGALLLIVNTITKQFDVVMLDNRLMQVITYHCLAIGFAARSPENAAIACVTFFVLWISYTVYLFRRRIFRKKYAVSRCPFGQTTQTKQLFPQLTFQWTSSEVHCFFISGIPFHPFQLMAKYLWNRLSPSVLWS